MAIWKRLPLFLCLALALLLQTGCKEKAQSYTIGIDPSWFPIAAEQQERAILAFSIDLLVDIAKRKNLRIATINMSWDNLVWGLENHHYDAILSPMRPFTFYKSTYDFSDPYLKAGPVLVTPTDSRLRNITDIPNSNIAILRNSPSALLVQSYPGVILFPFGSRAQIVENIARGEVDAGLVEVLIAQEFVKNFYAGRLTISSPPLDNQGLRLITLLGKNSLLQKRFNAGLAEAKADGTYDALLRKWGLAPDGKSVADLNPETLDHFLDTFAF